jgi:hypothetical protein
MPGDIQPTWKLNAEISSCVYWLGAFTVGGVPTLWRLPWRDASLQFAQEKRRKNVDVHGTF